MSLKKSLRRLCRAKNKAFTHRMNDMKIQKQKKQIKMRMLMRMFAFHLLKHGLDKMRHDLHDYISLFSPHSGFVGSQPSNPQTPIDNSSTSNFGWIAYIQPNPKTIIMNASKQYIILRDSFVRFMLLLSPETPAYLTHTTLYPQAVIRVQSVAVLSSGGCKRAPK